MFQRQYKCKICSKFHQNAILAIKCCVLKNIKLWTDEFKIGDIIRIDNFYLKNLCAKPHYFYANMITTNQHMAFSYYYSVVGKRDDKLLVYSDVSYDLRVCGGYITEKNASRVKNVTASFMQKQSREWSTLKRKNSRISTLTLTELKQFDLIDDNPELANTSNIINC